MKDADLNRMDMNKSERRQLHKRYRLGRKKIEEELMVKNGER